MAGLAVLCTYAAGLAVRLTSTICRSPGESGGAVGGATAIDAVPIDENLFDTDDLDGLDEELDELDISQ